MTSQGKTWDRLKAEYLRRVEKTLSSVKHPRSRDVLDDVRSHLDRRFAELDPAQRNYKNLQAIITEMGPASDYAELLAPQRRRHTNAKSSAKIPLVACPVYRCLGHRSCHISDDNILPTGACHT